MDLGGGGVARHTWNFGHMPGSCVAESVQLASADPDYIQGAEFRKRYAYTPMMKMSEMTMPMIPRTSPVTAIPLGVPGMRLALRMPTPPKIVAMIPSRTLR